MRSVYLIDCLDGELKFLKPGVLCVHVDEPVGPEGSLAFESALRAETLPGFRLYFLGRLALSADRVKNYFANMNVEQRAGVIVVVSR